MVFFLIHQKFDSLKINQNTPVIETHWNISALSPGIALGL